MSSAIVGTLWLRWRIYLDHDLQLTPDRKMPMNRDLREDDLVELLTAFYATVAQDELLAPYFAPVDMREHIPRIADFWSTLLFQTARYSGNAFRPHLAMPGLTPEHFAHWLAVLEATVDARFAGEAATRMKDYGHRIAFSMQMRLGLAPFVVYPSRK